MRQAAFLSGLCLFALGTLHAQERLVAFDRGGGIFVTDLAGKKATKVGRGSWPDISPDGTKVVFNTEAEKTPERHIAVVDRATGKQTIFNKVPSDNCHSPVWSPDGSQVAFYIFTEGDWQIGLVDANGENFHFLKKAEANNRSYWGACWAPDGKSIYCQDMDAIYRLGLDGKMLRKWVVAELMPNGGFNSGSHLAPSPDGKSLLFDADMDEEVTIPDWDGPPPAIWKLDFTTDKATRISLPGAFAWQPCWLSADEFLYTNVKSGEKTFSIWRQKLDGTNRSLVMKNASSASVSRN